MAIAYITSYFGANEVAMGYAITGELLTTNASTFSVSAAIDPAGKSNRIRISSDTDQVMERGGSAPDGAGVLERVPANSTEYFWVRAGDKIALKEI